MTALIFILVLNTVFGFMTVMFLARFVMQWRHLPFRNRLGEFVMTTTNWLVLPLRRFIPGFFGLDLSSLLPAWWCQILLAGFEIVLFGAGGGDAPLAAAFGLLTLGGLYLLKVALYATMVVVLVAALLSWINPQAPMTPFLNTLAEPFLSPIRRVIPLIAGVDLSPLVAVLVIQIGLIITDGLTRHFILMIWGPG